MPRSGGFFKTDKPLKTLREHRIQGFKKHPTCIERKRINMRTPIIAGNWKMNMTPAEAERLLRS